jgi:hypothetical protein
MEEQSMSNSYVVVSGIIFGVVSLAHLVRALGNVPIQIGAAAIPVWVSWAGAVIAAGLCVWAFRSRTPSR